MYDNVLKLKEFETVPLISAKTTQNICLHLNYNKGRGFHCK